MADQLRVVVAGAGAFGQEHLRTLAKMDGVTVVGVADINGDAARREAERVGSARWDTHAANLMDQLRPDGVVVATPGDTHVALARHALALGTPVLVEKPVALTPAEAEILAQAEAASTGFVLPGHILRFSASHRRFAAIAESDDIGPLLSVTARRYRDDDHAKRYPGIDPILMTMIHDIDLAVWITKATGVELLAHRRPAGLQRSETIVTATDSAGAIWRLATAWTFPGLAPPDRIEVVGERGSVELEAGHHIRQFGAVSRRIELDGLDLDEALLMELSYFLRCIRRGELPQIVTLREAINGLSFATAAIESLQTGTTARP